MGRHTEAKAGAQVSILPRKGNHTPATSPQKDWKMYIHNHHNLIVPEREGSKREVVGGDSNSDHIVNRHMLTRQGAALPSQTLHPISSEVWGARPVESRDAGSPTVVRAMNGCGLESLKLQITEAVKRKSYETQELRVAWSTNRLVLRII